MCQRAGCETVYQPRRRWQRFCSPECRSWAWEDANPRVTRDVFDRLRSGDPELVMGTGDAGRVNREGSPVDKRRA